MAYAALWMSTVSSYTRSFFSPPAFGSALTGFLLSELLAAVADAAAAAFCFHCNQLASLVPQSKISICIESEAEKRKKVGIVCEKK